MWNLWKRGPRTYGKVGKTNLKMLNLIMEMTKHCDGWYYVVLEDSQLFLPLILHETNSE